ncbi:cofactor-independent phosphoglycerate mutase [Planctomycetales bacterium]|nr:cofactor-independent phosphoglycerate mutase [Planctomycetales bacterium]
MQPSKFVIVIPDGCADWTIESLGNRTPLQAARLPNIKALARRGIVGRSNNVPAELAPGSDVATLGLLGYDPKRYYTGRAPLEAAAQSIELGENDWAIRCNLVTVNNGIMQSFTAGHISSEEGAELIESLNRYFVSESAAALKFIAGVSYRNLAILRDAEPGIFDRMTRTFPPHDFTDKQIAEALPAGRGSELLLSLMEKSKTVLQEHPVNKKRLAEGKLPAIQVWLWGIGQKPQLPLFKEQPNAPQAGAMITAVDLLRGIAKNIGWDTIEVPGSTGYTDTDYAAKGSYAAEALKTHDIVCVHIEAPDESGHEGSAEKKVQALEDIDSKTLPPILEALKQYENSKLFISPDHPTPCALKTHTRDFVPWLFVTGNADSKNPAQTYDEETAKNSLYRFDDGYKLMRELLVGEVRK